MASIQHQVEINWPVQALFNYMADVSNNASWQRQVVDAEWIGMKRHSPGSAFVQTRRVLGKDVSTTMQVTDFHLYQKHAWVALDDRLRQRLAFEFEPRGERTLLKLTIGFNPVGRMRQLESALMRSAIREGYDNLHRLKNMLENLV
jgi:uncharacterized membrane protein